jgi:hypothetical protein
MGIGSTRGFAGLRRRGAALLAAIVATACTQWNIARGPSPDAARTATGKWRGKKHLRVELTSDSVMHLYSPTILGDSIVAWRVSGRQTPDARVAVAVADVRTIEYPGLTALGIAGTALALSVLYLLVSCAALAGSSG